VAVEVLLVSGAMEVMAVNSLQVVVPHRKQQAVAELVAAVEIYY
jgi:hypothetical protein